jgi:Ca2+/Na+ antiporter
VNRIWYVAKAIFTGLCITQILATWHVYLSNKILFQTVSAIGQAGYLTVPNTLVAPTLKAFGPAFFGGCFFTLSIGAGLSVFSVIFAWIWDRILARNRSWLVPVVFLWLTPVAAMNGQGFSPMVTAYFLVVPFVVFVATLKWIPPEDIRGKWRNKLIPIAPIALLTLIWTANADRFLFLDIRDFLLLSNPVGQKVDSFYYRYTLYPAQAFKTLQQKTLKTCHMPILDDKVKADRLQHIFIENDYLPVAADGPVDLEVVISENKLELQHAGETVIQTTLAAFFSHPRKHLNDFSTEMDRHGPFRQATIVFLVLGFPVLLYIMVFALIHFVTGFFVPASRAFVITAGLCFVIGLGLLAPLVLDRSKTVPAGQVSETLNAPSWQQRVSGLRTVVDEKQEIGRFPAYRQMVTSPHLPERYWVAKALGASRQPETFHALMTLLDDPHPNVVSMAFHALSQRGDRRVLGEVLKRIETSGHWYNQWYAYRALRALGWRQREASEAQ